MDTPHAPVGTLKKIWEFLKNILLVAERLARIEKKIDQMSSVKSTEAKFCPNCDARMRITNAHAGGAWFRCEPCDVALHYKIGGH